MTAMTIAETLKSAGARLTMADDDVRALLEDDHDQVRRILRGLVDGEQGRSRKLLLEQLKTKLTAHSRAEEAVVYDALIRARAKMEVHVLAEEGYVEHSVVDHLLERISGLEVGSETWLAHAKVIRELLETHIAEEQNQTFAQLGDLFSREELADMGAAFLRSKTRVLERRAPKVQRNVARVVAGQRSRKSVRKSAASARKSAKRGGEATRGKSGGRTATRGRGSARRAG
jgi:hypothetical protein